VPRESNEWSSEAISSLSYVPIPVAATLLQSRVRSLPETSIPQSWPSSPPSSPTFSRAYTLLPHLLLHGLPSPSPTDSVRSARDANRESLVEQGSMSIQTTTVNFRRFVAKSGPIFLIQHRLRRYCCGDAAGRKQLFGWRFTRFCVSHSWTEISRGTGLN
jgi:hypothetical protein